jgi:glutamate dehydrogenase
VALVDADASVHDPDGVNKDELVRLARARLTLSSFNPNKLSSRGFLVKTTDKNVTLPDGTVVEDGMKFRNTFHLTPYTRADVFVPCGGRPASVTLENVNQLVDAEGTTGELMLTGKFEKVAARFLKHRIIVEGANLFLTQDARLALERCGVVVIKDATANKGGVTSSSLEVLTGLSLSDEEHARLMSAKSETDAPQFYKDIVKEICARVELNANREFEAVWREFEASPTTPKTLICDALSEKIVTVRTNILKSNIFEDRNFLRYVMVSYTPKTLLNAVPIDVLMSRVPANYQHAICAMWLASDYVYKYGAHGTEFDFYQFMQYHSKAAEAI